VEARIQYAQTADGVSIAFWALGGGMTLVHVPLPFSYIQLERQFPQWSRRQRGRSSPDVCAARRRLVPPAKVARRLGTSRAKGRGVMWIARNLSPEDRNATTGIAAREG
jgi:hypothetical protein